MSVCVNKAILVGFVGKDIEMHKTSNGGKYGVFSLATSKTIKLKNGETRDNTNWHLVKVWGNLASICEKIHVCKGSLIYVEGEIDYRQWEDADGNRRYGTEITASSILKKDRNEGGQTQGTTPQMPNEDEDLPF